MLLRILFFLSLILLLPLWYIDRRLLKTRLPRRWRMAVATPNALLLAALAAMSFHESYSATAAQIKATQITLTLYVAIPELLLALFLLAASALRRWPRAAKATVCTGITTALLALATLIYGFNMGYKNFREPSRTFHFNSLPAAFAGYHIVQISDLHVGTLQNHPEVLAELVERINRSEPDLVVFTGDLVNYRAEELFSHEAVLRRIKARDDVLAIMGNHDYMGYFRWDSEAARRDNVRLLQDHIRGMGWTLLLNDHRILRRGADSIAVVGVENDGRPPFPALADLPAAQRGLQEGCFRILLSHDPTHWRRAVLPETDIPLTLSGHTHGMQFMIGGYSPAAWFYPEWRGTYTADDGRLLHVSIGAGEVMLPFRLGAWPEAVHIYLQPAAPQTASRQTSPHTR